MYHVIMQCSWCNAIINQNFYNRIYLIGKQNQLPLNLQVLFAQDSLDIAKQAGSHSTIDDFVADVQAIFVKYEICIILIQMIKLN